MEKKTGKIIGMVVCVAVIVLGIASLVLYLGGFIPRIADCFSDEETTEAVTQPEEIFISAAQGPVDGMRAVRLEKYTDYTDITQAYDAVSDISEWGFNTVIFSKCDVSEAAQLATQAKNNGLFSVYLVDADLIVKSGVPDELFIDSLCGTGVDSVLISMSQGVTQSEAALAAETVRNADSSLYIGIFASAEKSYKTVCRADAFDYKYIDITVPTSSVAGEYSAFLSEYCDGTTEDTVFGMHTELVGNADGYEKPDEIMNQFSAVTQTGSSGFGFYRYGILAKNSNSLRDAITDFMENGIMKDYFKQLIISTPKETVFETNQSHVSFVGTGDITKPLTVNGQSVQMIDDGYFSVEHQLNPGINTFVFEHNGKKITYTVTYKIKLIDSVSPSGSVNAPGGTTLDIAVVAHKLSSVSATLGGVTVSLVRSDEYNDDNTADEGSDYTYFVGSYTLPESGASDRSLGRINVKAVYGSMTESQSGASVTVNAKQSFTPPVDTPVTTSQVITTLTEPDSTSSVTHTSSDESSSVIESSQPSTTVTEKPTTTAPTQIFKLLTPYENNGVSGKSKMIVIKNDYSETLPSTTTNDVSVPYFTTLPKGTVDYVVSTSSYDGIKYYVLASGRRVYQKDCEYLSDGFNMPNNEIRTVGVSKSSDETKITLTMRWKVPFNVREYPQTYYTQTSGRPYSVHSFTAEYIDIVFYYTTLTDTAPSLDTSVISRAKWINNDDGSSTLRLYLKKKGGFYGIKYYYNNDGTLTLSVKERANSSIIGKVIMLDPGHGGNDPGAIGTAIVGNRNIYEETINMSIANKVKSKLEALGATVILTRNSSGSTVSLETRAALCRANNPEVFVAIHCDASGSSSSAAGTTAYYYKSYSYPLAYYLNKSIVSTYQNVIYANNSAMADKADDKGSMFKGFKVTRVEECPAVLIEYGFVTNVTECNVLANDASRNLLAQATVDGLVDYFKNS